MRKSVDDKCPINSSFNTPVPFQFGANGIFYIARGDVPLESYLIVDDSDPIYNSEAVTVTNHQSHDFRLIKLNVKNHVNADPFDFFGGDLIICTNPRVGYVTNPRADNFIFIPYLNLFYKLDKTISVSQFENVIYDEFIRPWCECPAKLRCIAALHRLSFQLIKNADSSDAEENQRDLRHLQTLINVWSGNNHEIEIFDGLEEKAKLIKKSALDKTRNFIASDTHRRIRVD